MMLYMSGRIVQAEQGIKISQRFLSLVSAHFLRFVQNQYGAGSLDDINRPSASEFVKLFVNAARFFAAAAFLKRY